MPGPVQDKLNVRNTQLHLEATGRRRANSEASLSWWTSLKIQVILHKMAFIICFLLLQLSHLGDLHGKRGTQYLSSKPKKDNLAKHLLPLETLYSQNPWLTKSKPPIHGLLTFILQDVMRVKSQHISIIDSLYKMIRWYFILHGHGFYIINEL